MGKIGIRVPKKSPKLGDVPQDVREHAKMRLEEKQDMKQGTPGYWATLTTATGKEAKPFYVPGWMVAAEQALSELEGPQPVQQIGPFWAKEE